PVSGALSQCASSGQWHRQWWTMTGDKTAILGTARARASGPRQSTVQSDHSVPRRARHLILIEQFSHKPTQGPVVKNKACTNLSSVHIRFFGCIIIGSRTNLSLHLLSEYRVKNCLPLVRTH